MPGAVRRPSAAPAAGQDPALSTSHPFHDVARHGILQVAGESQLGGPQGPRLPTGAWAASLQCGCAPGAKTETGTNVAASVWREK